MCTEILLTPFIDADLAEVMAAQGSMPVPPPARSTTRPKHRDPASDQCNIRGWEPVF
jgi:hypothetical protein